MKLSPMRYKTFVWPHNPRVYTIDYQREMGEHKIPFGLYTLQDLGRTKRVMRGEGVFVGAEAYRQFSELASLFYEQSPGMLTHPLWQSAKVYFVALRLEQEPRPDYVRYSFEFWEVVDGWDGAIVEKTKAQVGAVSGGSPQSRPREVHIVRAGESLWKIARQYGVTVAELVGVNPQIANPNLIYVGQEVVLP